MTAPSLVVPVVARAADGRAKAHLLASILSGLSSLPLIQFAGAGVVLGFAIVVEALGRPRGVDPAVVVPVLVVAATALGGYLGGAVAAALGIGYVAIYYVSAASLGIDGAVTRVVVSTVLSVVAVWLTGTVRLARDAAVAAANRERQRAARTSDFTRRLASVPGDSLPDAVVRGIARDHRHGYGGHDRPRSAVWPPFR